MELGIQIQRSLNFPFGLSCLAQSSLPSVTSEQVNQCLQVGSEHLCLNTPPRISEQSRAANGTQIGMEQGKMTEQKGKKVVTLVQLKGEVFGLSLVCVCVCGGMDSDYHSDKALKEK